MAGSAGLGALSNEREPELRAALSTALMTPEGALDEEQRAWLGGLKS
jgi:hypothetical protein